MRRKRSKQRKNKLTRILLINLTVLLIGLLALGGFYLSTNSIAESSKQVASEKLLEKVAIKKTDYTEIEKSKPEPKKEPYTDIQIAAAGDIMFHGPQLKAGYDTASDSYDSTDMFSEVKPIFEAADLAIAIMKQQQVELRRVSLDIQLLIHLMKQLMQLKMQALMS